jgi:hypothetical protein
MKKPVLLTLILAAGTLLAACHKDSTPPSTSTHQPPVPPPVKGPFLYVGGTNITNALYWKISLSQNTPTPIVDTVPAGKAVTSMVSVDSTIYYTAGTGGYWQKDSFITVQGATTIQYMALSGGNVYTTGFDNSANLAYWVNNTETNLQNSIGRATFPYEAFLAFGVSGIAVSGNNVLVPGTLTFENEPYSPPAATQGTFGLLWTNGALQTYGGGVLLSITYQVTVGVATEGNDVYVAGQFPDTTFAGGYWKDSVWNEINNGHFIPSSVTNIGGNIYIPGYTYTLTSTNYQQQAAWWENGTLNTLGGSVAAAMVSDSTNLYILGIDNNSNLVVWKNGNLFATLGSADYLRATCMAIAN